LSAIRGFRNGWLPSASSSAINRKTFSSGSAPKPVAATSFAIACGVRFM
jgi:hypothetical protein